jgi:hypothetical protein
MPNMNDVLIDWGTASTTLPNSVLTANGSGSYNWATLTNGTGSTAWPTVTVDPNLQGQTLSVKGNADISGELTVQGVKLSDRLDKIEERLGILRPNEELEEKWDNLRALRNAYMELEAEIKEKESMWSILKK